MRGKKLRHLELIEAQLRRLRVGCKHLYTDLLEALAVLGQQRDLRIDQRRNSVDLFLAANGQDRVQITRIINARHKVMRVRDIQSRCQLGQVSGNDPVAVIHGLAKVLEQLNAPSGAAE